jgi:GTP-binding protein
MHAEYITSAAEARQLPKETLPEIAFVGRSNCGKSSLLNALANQKDLARKSRTPGRTQMVNFFEINRSVYFVDLPGYGFAAMNRNKREPWFHLIEKYLEREAIEHVLFLFDTRRDFDEEDLELLNFLTERHNVIIVYTKADKFSKSQLQVRLRELQQQLATTIFAKNEVFVTSSLAKSGIEELRKKLVPPSEKKAKSPSS